MTHDDNELLTRVGPGTPCGEMLRRYWWPIEATDHVTDTPVPVRLMGEDLVLFRDGAGKLGLLGRKCTHRGASLEFGRVESHGIRCCYHGWVYDVNGKCLEQPAEPEGSNLKDSVTQLAYHVQEAGGLIFAYLGPAPAPALPKADMLFDKTHRTRVWGRDVHNNWLQQSENAADPYHIMALHSSAYPEIALVRPEVTWTETPTGITNYSVYPDGQVDSFCLFFPSAVRVNVHRVGQEPCHYTIYNVPIDDTHTVAWWVWASESTAEPYKVTAEQYQKTKPNTFRRVEDGWFKLATEAQDDAAISSQGAIADRTQEFLASSDRGVVMYRRMLKRAIDAVQQGQDPQGVLRVGDPRADEILYFDVVKKGFGSEAGQVRAPELGSQLNIVPAWERHKLFQET